MRHFVNIMLRMLFRVLRRVVSVLIAVQPKYCFFENFQIKPNACFARCRPLTFRPIPAPSPPPLLTIQIFVVFQLWPNA